ncbi:MAG: Gfo/Idh/MocA family protein [Armatimonadota bacterium]
MSDRELRIAMCGCGNNAKAHAHELQKIAGVSFYAFWNREEDAHLACDMLQEFGGEYCTSDLERIAADPRVDAVYITTMHNDRLRLVRAMAEAGKPVFVEKPLTHSPEALRAMYRLLQAKPTLFQTGYKTRFNSMVEKAHAMLPEPELLFAHVFDGRWPDNHLNQLEIGGGNIRAQGVYAADALHFMAGSLPVATTAVAKNRRQPSGIEDTFCATFEFANGAIGSIAVADAGVAAGTVSKFFLEAAGGGRGVTLLDRFARLEYLDGANAQTFTGEEDGFRRESEHFHAAVRNGEDSPCDFLQGAIPSIMIYRALEAAASGRRETIDIEAWLNEA